MSRKPVELALLVATGSVLFLFESLIPRPLPWLKPGLANTVTLFALYRYGMREAVTVTLLRVLLGSLLIGTLFNPAFILSLGGGLTAAVAMGTFKRIGHRTFSVLGVSAIGAFSHACAQIALAYVLIVRHSELFILLPLILLASLFTGFIVGLVTHFTLLKSRIYGI